MKSYRISIISRLEAVMTIDQENIKVLPYSNRNDVILYFNSSSKEFCISGEADLSFVEIKELLLDM